MPTSFSLSGNIALTNLPDQLQDFKAVIKVGADTCGAEELLCIRDGELLADIDTSEASYRASDALYAAMSTFLTKHAASGGTFIAREDDEAWYFGPTEHAVWQAHYNHLEYLATAAQEALGTWLRANPEPEQ